MKATHLIAALSFSASVTVAADNLIEVTKDEAKISRMNLVILQRSVALLGGKQRVAAPKSSRMIYNDQKQKVIQFFAVEGDQIDKAQPGAAEHPPYRWRIAMTVFPRTPWPVAARRAR